MNVELDLSDESLEAIEKHRAALSEELLVELTVSQVASMLILRGAGTKRKPSTKTATAARTGRSKYDRKKVSCACGCGEIVTTPDANGKPRKFRPGHSSRNRPPTRQKAEPNENQCACGCGETVLSPNKWGRKVQFKHGHHRKAKAIGTRVQAVRKPIVEDETKMETVWNGRDPLTPSVRRESEDRY